MAKIHSSNLKDQKLYFISPLKADKELREWNHINRINKRTPIHLQWKWCWGLTTIQCTLSLDQCAYKLDVRKLPGDHGIKAKAVNKLERIFQRKVKAAASVPCNSLLWWEYHVCQMGPAAQYSAVCARPRLCATFTRCSHVRPPASPGLASLPRLWLLEGKTRLLIFAPGWHEAPRIPNDQMGGRKAKWMREWKAIQVTQTPPLLPES